MLEYEIDEFAQLNHNSYYDPIKEHSSCMNSSIAFAGENICELSAMATGADTPLSFGVDFHPPKSISPAPCTAECENASELGFNADQGMNAGICYDLQKTSAY